MDAVRQALQQMGGSMNVVVHQIYNVMDLCNDGQLRKLSEQGFLNSRESAGETVVSSAAASQPSTRRSVLGAVYKQPQIIILCQSSCFRSLSLLFHAGQAAIKLPSAEASKRAQCTSPGQYTPYIKGIIKTPES